MPLCVNDSAEISLTLFSLMGSLDLESVKFQPLTYAKQPNQDDIRDYNRFKFLAP